MTDQEMVTDYSKTRVCYHPFPTSLFKFRVKATDHVVISCTASPLHTHPVHEICIGCDYNTNSYISFNDNKIKEATPDILDPNNYRSFWINWQKDSITVGKKNEDTPFLSWANPTFTAKYFGLATHGALCFWIIESFPKPLEVYSYSSPEFQTYYPISGGLMRFKVKAPCNASFVLSSGIGKSNYQLSIGHGNNTLSFLYKVDDFLVTAKTPGILDAKEFRGFWVCWHKIIRWERN
ncbi:hypothetical protein JTB14_028867 [Gonioctena quinquepunctata]|nr:hypothetical protein JTB14_028867 [Gonioctena quinquepunctata]